MRRGFIYLMAVLDWFSRYVVAWRTSATLKADFCYEALEEALNGGRPEVFNTDQGSQFTSGGWTGRLAAAQVKISMDGRGRCFDNIFVERLWRSVKYEEVYLKDYGDRAEADRSLAGYFEFYNHERIHQGLDWRTPAEVHYGPEAANSGAQGASLAAGATADWGAA
jgi:putative transposase